MDNSLHALSSRDRSGKTGVTVELSNHGVWFDRNGGCQCFSTRWRDCCCRSHANVPQVSLREMIYVSSHRNPDDSLTDVLLTHVPSSSRCSLFSFRLQNQIRSLSDEEWDDQNVIYPMPLTQIQFLSRLLLLHLSDVSLGFTWTSLVMLLDKHTHSQLI